MAKPSTLQDAKTIHKPLAATVGMSGVTLWATANNIVITTAITSALTTAGNGGVSVPLQLSADLDTEGLLINAGDTLQIYSEATKAALQIDGNEVYGKLTESGGAYTISFFSLVGGVETATDLEAADYAFTVPYFFSLVDYPHDAATRFASKYVGQDAPWAGTLFREVVTITALNTLADLSKKPVANTIQLSIDGHIVHELQSAMTVSGKTITWVAASANYDLETTDNVVASYVTNE